MDSLKGTENDKLSDAVKECRLPSEWCNHRSYSGKCCFYEGCFKQINVAKSSVENWSMEDCE